MERRLYILMTIGATVTIAFGLALLWAVPAYRRMGWLHVKLGLVLVLIVYHFLCGKFTRDFAAHRNARSSRWYRGFNEVPSLLLIGIVILAVVKPF
jgi:putative membrane protein